MDVCTRVCVANSLTSTLYIHQCTCTCIRTCIVHYVGTLYMYLPSFSHCIAMKERYTCMPPSYYHVLVACPFCLPLYGHMHVCECEHGHPNSLYVHTQCTCCMCIHVHYYILHVHIHYYYTCTCTAYMYVYMNIHMECKHIIVHVYSFTR